MAQSLAKIYIHVIFRTKNQDILIDDNMRDELHRLINILKIRKSIIGGNRFRMNTGGFLKHIMSNMMRGMFGISNCALSGLENLFSLYPGRCPGLTNYAPLGRGKAMNTSLTQS